MDNILVLVRTGLIFAVARRDIARTQRLFYTTWFHFLGMGKGGFLLVRIAWWKKQLGTAGDSVGGRFEQLYMPCSFVVVVFSCTLCYYPVHSVLLLLLFIVLFHCELILSQSVIITFCDSNSLQHAAGEKERGCGWVVCGLKCFSGNIDLGNSIPTPQQWSWYWIIFIIFPPSSVLYMIFCSFTEKGRNNFKIYSYKLAYSESLRQFQIS